MTGSACSGSSPSPPVACSSTATASNSRSPIDSALVASTLHGFELDAHIAYPDATACDGLTDLAITSYPA